MNVTFITDPLVTSAGSVRPAFLLARAFRKEGHSVTITSTQFAEQLVEVLSSEGITIKKAISGHSLRCSFPTLGAWGGCLLWLREADRSFESDFVVNTSSCIISKCHVYYAQGPMTRTLSDIMLRKHSLPAYVYHMLEKPATFREKELIRRFRELARSFVANSRFCAAMYEEWGIPVDGIINPPMDCSFFKSSTTSPTRDYVLTTTGVYGKEGSANVIRMVADAGVRIKIFGNVLTIPASLTNHPNIDILGRVTDLELVDLYSNALFTLFAFAHEPFGYIPVESMACGTPVLTYRRQGPCETVVQKQTGWLVDSDKDLRNLAVAIWKDGYAETVNSACVKRASEFDITRISSKWLKLAKSTVGDQRH